MIRGTMQRYTPALLSIFVPLWSPVVFACEGLSIAVVSEDRQALATDRIEWWYTGQERNKKVATCDVKACSEWRLQTPRNDRTSIELVAVRSHENDEDCADLFRGTMEVNEQNDVQTVAVQFTETVCK